MWNVFFKPLRIKNCYRIIKNFEPYVFNKNEVCLLKGSSSDGIYFIKSGYVRQCHPNDNNVA